MRRAIGSLVLGILLSGATPGSALAQGFHATPAIGVFIPASDFEGVREGAQQARLDRGGTMALGFNVEAGWLRGSVAYASGVRLSDSGAQGRVGDGSVLVVAADLLVRPIPTSPLQPYLLGGVGLKRQEFTFTEATFPTNPFPEDTRDLALHLGVGADLMMGSLGVMVEATDFITRTDDGGFGQHDVFLMLGLRVRLGGP